MKNNLTTGAKTAMKEIADIWDTTETTPEKTTADSDAQKIKDEAQARLDSDERRKKLAEEIAKLEEESRQRQMNIDQKILDLKKKIAETSEIALREAGAPSEKGDTAYRDQLVAAAELVKLEKQRQDEIDKTSADVQQRQERDATEAQASMDRIAQARAAGDKIDQDNRMANMTTAQKIAELSKSQKLATIDSFQAAMGGDVEKSVEKQNEAKTIGGQISSLEETKKKEDAAAPPSIMVEDLRKIGGGGLGALSSNPQAGVENRLDRLIKAVEGNKPLAPPPVPAPKPF
jgi:hypothetical protein